MSSSPIWLLLPPPRVRLLLGVKAMASSSPRLRRRALCR
jgi:hypothetical protein